MGAIGPRAKGVYISKTRCSGGVEILYLIQNSQAVKKECGPQKGYGKKICEIQGEWL